MHSLEPARSPRFSPVVFALLVAGTSLILLTLVDVGLRQILIRTLPDLNWITRVRLPSLLVCLALYLWTRHPAPSRVAPNWRAVLILSAAWLLPTALVVTLTEVWTPTVRSWTGALSFMVTGLLAEELLFRGAVYQTAERALPRATRWGLPLWPVLVSALCFGLSHWQYHGFRFTGAAAVQIAYTTVMGLFFGSARALSKRLWVPVALHAATNLISLLSNNTLVL